MADEQPWNPPEELVEGLAQLEDALEETILAAAHNHEECFESTREELQAIAELLKDSRAFILIKIKYTALYPGRTPRSHIKSVAEYDFTENIPDDDTDERYDVTITVLITFDHTQGEKEIIRSGGCEREIEPYWLNNESGNEKDALSDNKGVFHAEDITCETLINLWKTTPPPPRRKK